jgi:hypothetical protein
MTQIWYLVTSFISVRHFVGSVFWPVRFLLPVYQISWFLYTLNIYAQYIFRHIFLSNYWWQKSDIWCSMIGENICMNKTTTYDKKTVRPTARQIVNLMRHFNCKCANCSWHMTFPITGVAQFSSLLQWSGKSHAIETFGTFPLTGMTNYLKTATAVYPLIT